MLRHIKGLGMIRGLGMGRCSNVSTVGDERQIGRYHFSIYTNTILMLEMVMVCRASWEPPRLILPPCPVSMKRNSP